MIYMVSEALPIIPLYLLSKEIPLPQSLSMKTTREKIGFSKTIN